jgi:hypothetical protein
MDNPVLNLNYFKKSGFNDAKQFSCEFTFISNTFHFE